MMMRDLSTVVQLPKKYAGVRNAEDAMSVIRDGIYREDIKILARRVGVTPSCLMAIRSGRTRWPRPHTFFGLIHVLNLEMILRRKDT